MIQRWFSLALFVVVFVPDFLHAQPRDNSAPPAISVGSSQASGPPTVSGRFSLNLDKMYEDIEIMRRLLDRKLHPLYPRTQYFSENQDNLLYTPAIPRMEGSPDWILPQRGGARHMAEQLLKIETEKVSPYLEGVYLKGQGVIYTATISSLRPVAKAKPPKESVSEWESVRRQVRNEKEERKMPEAGKPASLSDVLLEVLAANGRHFSQLGENESVTIVLTVHDESASSPPAKSGGGSAKRELKPATSGGGSDLRGKVNDLELLGELHFKQGKYSEAITAFMKAMEIAKRPKQKAELCRKLAQCYLMRQDPADLRNARATLEEAIAQMEKEEEAEDKPAPAAKPAAALLVKLIVSAPKKLLDQVGEGKIPIQDYQNPARDFFHQATVETLRFGDRR
jgi:tetratricopeptide (TPR) repeat protein